MGMAYNDGLPWYYGYRYQDLAAVVFRVSKDFTFHDFNTNWR